jgi:glycosyltransferase involved in cell wall biosynthesis
LSSSEPVVSIVTPTFNHERYIRQCLESAIAQTDPRWEQIVVDDGSDDGTEAIVRSMEEPRIRYIRRGHRGIMHLAEAYNLALEMSRGAFIAVLEGDDFWPTDKIERQLRHFDRPEIVLSWGVTGITNEAGELQETHPKANAISRMQGRTQGEIIRSLLNYNFVPAVTVMCRRDALEKIGGFQQPDGLPTTDYPTWLELCRVGQFASAYDLLGFHRMHDRQASVQNKAEMDLVLYWGTRFIERLPASERDALGVSLEEAHQVERKRKGYLDYAAGRARLGEHQGPQARVLFRQALRNGSGMTRLKACFGLGFSYLGLDLERIVSATNRLLGR